MMNRREWLRLLSATGVAGVMNAAVDGNLLWATDDVSRDASRLRVMSFNIRYATASDGENRWSWRREFLGDCIAEQSPDLLGLQEVLPEQSEWIAGYLSERARRGEGPEYAFFGRTREPDPAQGEAVTIFYRTDRLERIVEDGDTFWVSETPEVVGSQSWNTACRRVVTWSRFRLRTLSAEAFSNAENREIYFFNTHLDHISAEARLNGAKLLVKRIADRSNPSAPVILTGDFNCGESSEPIVFLRDSGLVDTFRMMDPDSTEVGTFHAFTGSAGKDKIDYIFVMPDLKACAAEILRTSRDGRWPSDHFPVVADVRLP